MAMLHESFRRKKELIKVWEAMSVIEKISLRSAAPDSLFDILVLLRHLPLGRSPFRSWKLFRCNAHRKVLAHFSITQKMFLFESLKQFTRPQAKITKSVLIPQKVSSGRKLITTNTW
jgi:hypothetical protein